MATGPCSWSSVERYMPILGMVMIGATAIPALSLRHASCHAGKMVVESKADMKKRGMRSPDLADAFLLTFASADKRKIERYRRSQPRNYSAWAV